MKHYKIKADSLEMNKDDACSDVKMKNYNKKLKQMQVMEKINMRKCVKKNVKSANLHRKTVL